MEHDMTKDELDAIAKRESYCAPFETRVSLTGAERDQLVALAKAFVLAADLLRESSAVCGAVIRAGQDNTGAVLNHQQWVDQFLATLSRSVAKEEA